MKLPIKHEKHLSYEELLLHCIHVSVTVFDFALCIDVLSRNDITSLLS